MRTTTRTLAALGLALPLPLLLAGPAAAEVVLPPDFSVSQQSYRTANVQWTEVDPTADDPVPGNWHLGSLFVQRSGFGLDVFGSIEDFECEEGETPFGGHGPIHSAPATATPAEPPPGGEPGACEYLGPRFLSGTDAVTLTVDIGRGTATLRGVLSASTGGHDGPGQVVGRPPVDITWKRTGSHYRYTRAETWEDADRSFSSQTRGIGWQARVSGTLGPMDFTDDADDSSSGGVEQYTERTRSGSGRASQT